MNVTKTVALLFLFASAQQQSLAFIPSAAVAPSFIYIHLLPDSFFSSRSLAYTFFVCFVVFFFSSVDRQTLP